MLNFAHWDARNHFNVYACSFHNINNVGCLSLVFTYSSQQNHVVKCLDMSEVITNNIGKWRETDISHHWNDVTHRSEWVINTIKHQWNKMCLCFMNHLIMIWLWILLITMRSLQWHFHVSCWIYPFRMDLVIMISFLCFSFEFMWLCDWIDVVEKI